MFDYLFENIKWEQLWAIAESLKGSNLTQVNDDDDFDNNEDDHPDCDNWCDECSKEYTFRKQNFGN